MRCHLFKKFLLSLPKVDHKAAWAPVVGQYGTLFRGGFLVEAHQNQPNLHRAVPVEPRISISSLIQPLSNITNTASVFRAGLKQDEKPNQRGNEDALTLSSCAAAAVCGG